MIKDVKIFGTIEKKTKPLQIEAGLLSFELFNGALRNIFFKNKEILRGIAYVSRDKNWGTYDYEIKDLQIYENSKTFNIIYTAKVNDNTQSLNMQAKIEGSTEGLKFSMEAIPATNFVTNRTGFVILHPLIDIVGQPVEIEETNGSIREGYFPLEIKPDQPFFNIRSLTNSEYVQRWLDKSDSLSHLTQIVLPYNHVHQRPYNAHFYLHLTLKCFC